MKKIRKRLLIILSLLILALSLQGCGKKEVEDLTITTAIGLDLTEEGNLSLCAQVLNASVMSTSPPDISPVSFVEAEGRTIQEILRKLATIITGKIFFSHFNMMIFGEDLARKGIEPYLNFFAINQDALHRYNIIVARGCKARDLLRIATTDSVPSVTMENKLKTAAEFYGLAKVTNTDQVMNDLRSEGFALTLSSLEIVGNPEEGDSIDNNKSIEPKAGFRVSSLAVFQNDRLYGYLPESASIGLTFMNGKIKTTVIVVTKADGILASVEIIKVKTKFKINLEGEIPKVKVIMDFQGSITEDLSGETRQDMAYIEDIAERASYEIRKLCEEALSIAQNWKLDIFGFGLEIYQKHYRYWQTIKDRYAEEIFPFLECEFVITGEICHVKP
jgi:spore germination protein KC